MNGIIESPFFKIFTTTNSILLGAGALYLVSFGRYTSLQTTYYEAELPTELPTGTKHGCSTDESHKYTESHGLEDFAQHLEEWNKSLSELEHFLANNVSRTRSKDVVDGLDEVDAMGVAGFHDSGLIFEKVDSTLNNVVSKIDQLRQMLRVKHNHNAFSFDELSALREDDSDTDSFLSAEGGVEDEVNQGVSKIDRVQQKALDVAGIHRDKPFYLMALEHYFKHGIKCRKKRARLVGCSSEAEFLAKIHCIRGACKVAFAKEDVQMKFERNATELLRFLITTAGKDHHECEKRWKALLEFCKNAENFKILEKELNKKGVPYITFYDLVLDFVVMDAFVDLENPPYSVQAAVQNSWLPTYIQQTGLETAVWGVLKAKMQMLEEPAGFLMHFYHLFEILTPVLAWGFLGSDKALKKTCNIFKDELLGFIKDLFSFQTADYTSVESLSSDISKLAEKSVLSRAPYNPPSLIDTSVDSVETDNSIQVLWENMDKKRLVKKCETCDYEETIRTAGTHVNGDKEKRIYSLVSNPKRSYFAMGAFKMQLFKAAILLFCGFFQHGQARGQTVFGLCDVGDVITARNGSLVVSKGRDCTRIILAPRGWRIKFTLHFIDMFDASAFIHDGGTVIGTLKYEQGKRVLIGGNQALVFYTSSNAILVHTDRITSNGNKFNATFEMLPHPSGKCACPPTVNAQAVCWFPPSDNFEHSNDELEKKCTTTCYAGHKFAENHAGLGGVGAISTTCHLHLEIPSSTWEAHDVTAILYNPNLTSCTRVKPVTEVLSTYTFTYANMSCAKLNMSVIESGVYKFLVNNRSTSYVGECYKDIMVNCTVRPVLATCKMPNLVKIEIRDNVQTAENETMTRKLFDILYGNVSANLQKRVEWYVTNDLLVNNATAINFQQFSSAHSRCPTNYATSGQGGAALRFCISCPLHTFKHFFATHLYSLCQKCPPNQRRLLNESMCVNGTKVCPTPSNKNCLHRCPLGKFYNNNSGICDWCDYGYFQNSTTALNPVCHRCPADNTTAFVGARSENDCMEKCRKGQFTKFPSCFDCGFGYFMPYEGNRFPKCYKCPPGNTTLNLGTVNQTGCVDQCTLGKYFNITQGMCMLCPNNTYQNETKPSNTRSCKMCPANRVTLSVGAMSMDSCLGPCLAGQYLDVTSRSCKLCPVNSYKDENQTSFTCKKCPEHKITSNEGSTNISQCIYSCNAGEFFNLTSKVCEPCPNNTYQNNVGQDSCKPCIGKLFTLRPGSRACIAPCNRGEFFNKSAEACMGCPVGYFQNETKYLSATCLACPLDYYADTLGSHVCTACPDRGITIATAATAMSACIESCGRGYYLNKTFRSCEKCLKGFYQDQQEYRNESCSKCASANLTTLTSGAKSKEECVGYCASSPNCLNGGKCTNIENDFNCTCPEHLAGKQCQTILDDINADRMEISVRFTNLVWNNNLSNPDTKDFMEVANRIENAVRGDLKNDTTFRTVKVDKLTQGSVIGDLVFNYVAGTDFNNPFDALTTAAADGKIGDLTVNSSFYIANYTCGTPLGMENGRIPDSAITSANKDNNHPFSNARLNHNGPGWTPRVNHIEDAYLQVDFQEVVQLTGIATQGSSYDGGNWLESYHFNYSIDGNTWLEYKEDTNQPKVLGANMDVNTVVRNNLKYPVRTRYVRIIKYNTSRVLSYRCEFYGCPIPKHGVLPTLVPPRTDGPTVDTSMTTNMSAITRPSTGTVDSSDDDDDGGSNTGLIVGLVLGILAAFIVIAVVVWYVNKKKMHSHSFGSIDAMPMRSKEES